MSVFVGKINNEDGSFKLAIGTPSPDGNGYKVVSFPEPGGTYEVTNNVPVGTGPGEFEQH